MKYNNDARGPRSIIPMIGETQAQGMLSLLFFPNYIW